MKFPIGVHSHSFLIIGQNGFKIDNTYYSEKMEEMTPKEMIAFREEIDQLDEDPGTTTYRVLDDPNVKLMDVGRENLRRVCTPDQKMEQKLAYETTCAFRPRFVMYDLKMRKYIKDKYGIEIPSLARKWHRLCWACFTPGDKLKYCSKCKIAKYCNQNCQRQDWKVHKELHGMQTQIEREEYNNLY